MKVAKDKRKGMNLFLTHPHPAPASKTRRQEKLKETRRGIPFNWGKKKGRMNRKEATSQALPAFLSSLFIEIDYGRDEDKLQNDSRDTGDNRCTYISNSRKLDF